MYVMIALDCDKWEDDNFGGIVLTHKPLGDLKQSFR